eukprot:3884421-Pleurochrysis_carterae.AAC.2
MLLTKLYKNYAIQRAFPGSSVRRSGARYARSLALSSLFRAESRRNETNFSVDSICRPKIFAVVAVRYETVNREEKQQVPWQRNTDADSAVWP